MKTKCPACGGSGQLGYFQGVSRFLLSWEECPQCSGTGYVEEHRDSEPKSEQNNGGGTVPKEGSRKK